MSIYNIKIKSVDGDENFLQNFKGKVSLITNVTGDCGNAPQFAVLETIYQKYKDYGFEVIAIPTSDYCGPGLTYGDHVYGTEDGKEAENFAKSTFKVTYSFSELLGSKPSPEDIIPGLPSKYGKTQTHELFKQLCNNFGYMSGNFEKYLVDRDGKVVCHFVNGTTLNQNYENRQSGLHVKYGAPRADIGYKEICEKIESLLGI
jgi:glutathione peroxidase